MAPGPDATPLKSRSLPAICQASPKDGSASVSTFAASAGSRMSLASSRSTSTPPTSRTSTTVISQRGSRVSSSTKARRCLVKELEVFNMADDDDTVFPALENTPMKESSGKRSISAPGMDSDRAASGSKHCHLQVAREEDVNPGVQCDAWAVDDWAIASQSLGSARTSPCSSARGMDRAQREVADAVLCDLQIDLQAQVHRAISEMSSWISEEITFARQQFQESRETTNCQMNEMWRKERLDMQSAQSELSCKVDRLNARLEEQVEAVGKLQEDASCWFLQVGGPQLSTNVMEARLVAEERKWRLKLEELQDGLANQNQHIDVLNAQSSNILRKLAVHDVELNRAKIEELRKNVGQHLPRIDKIDALCSSLGETVAQHETRIERVVEARHGEIESCTQRTNDLAKETGELARRIAAVDAQVLDNSKQLKDIGVQIVTNEREHLAELEHVTNEVRGFARKVGEVDVCALETSSRLGSLDARWNNGKVERLDEVQQVSDQLQKHEASIDSFRNEIHTCICSMEERIDKAVSDLGRDCRREQTELCEQLSKKAPVAELQALREAVESWVDNARQTHQLAMQGLASSLERVASTSLEHGTEIRKHQNYMKEMSQWIHEGVSREDCITEILLHIVEEDYPDLIVVLERRLQATSRHPSQLA